ncbi:MAG: NAD(+)/NADH kinase [Firmicutes bacterium]|nr:NAD(+)/NADH kinase [Bacillota bacterium]MCL5039083.1 NAD(+)/NADH kinase [Bacillota bacterium]
MKTIGIIANLGKKNALEVTGRLFHWLQERGLAVLLDRETAETLGQKDLGRQRESLGTEVDFVIVLGGDGTLLGAARAVAPTGRPLLGVNLGHLGFLTEVELRELYERLPDFLAGRYTLDERMLLDIQSPARSLPPLSALNEAVITKGAFARLIHLHTYVNDTYVDTYPADGLIVATPTGSTAYSLAAGGPIVDPRVEVMIITPICPHSLYARAMVINADDVVRVRIEANHHDLSLTIDGQEGYGLVPGDEIIIRRERNIRARLMRSLDWRFHDLLRRKLKENS